MDAAKSVSEPLHGFMVDSVRLVRRCNKPDRKGELHLNCNKPCSPYTSSKTTCSNLSFASSVPNVNFPF